MKYDVIVSLSGGIDSVVLLHHYAKLKKSVRAIYLDFGKPTSQRELASAKHHASERGIPLEVVSVPGLTQMVVGYVSPIHLMVDELDVGASPEHGTLPLSHTRKEKPRVSGFYVALSVVGYYAQVLGAGAVAFGITKAQTKTTPGVLPSLQRFAEAIHLLNPDSGKLAVETPLAGLTKAEIIRRGHELGVPLDLTWSCTLGGIVHCGQCGQCQDRRNAFLLAELEDTTTYRDQRPDLAFLP